MAAFRPILFVEDDPNLRYALEKGLNSEGFNVTATGSPFEALKLLDGPLPFDVLVTDMMLGKDGPHGVSLALMARTKRTGLPVVFITALRILLNLPRRTGR